MKTHRVILGAVILLLIAACATAPIKPVEFATEPQTPDEQAVAQTLEGWMTTLNEYGVGNKQALDKHVSFYTQDAKIYSLIDFKVITREQLKTSLLALQKFDKVGFTKAVIRMVPPDKSHVEGELLIYNPERTRYRMILDLIRREGQWFILEQQSP